MREPEAPTSVRVLAILGLVFAIFGVLGLIMSVVMMQSGGFGGPPNPVLEVYNKDKIYQGYTIGSLILSVPMLLLLAAGSFACLSLKPWGRKWLMIYAVLSILTQIGGMIFTIVYLIPLTLDAVPPGNSPQATGARIGAITGMFAGVIGGFIGMIYPGCILYFFRKPHVIDAFNGIFPEREDRRRRRRRDDDDEYERDEERDEPDERFTDRPR